MSITEQIRKQLDKLAKNGDNQFAYLAGYASQRMRIFDNAIASNPNVESRRSSLKPKLQALAIKEVLQSIDYALEDKILAEDSAFYEVLQNEIKSIIRESEAIDEGVKEAIFNKIDSVCQQAFRDNKLASYIDKEQYTERSAYDLDKVSWIQEQISVASQALKECSDANQYGDDRFKIAVMRTFNPKKPFEQLMEGFASPIQAVRELPQRAIESNLSRKKIDRTLNHSQQLLQKTYGYALDFIDAMEYIDSVKNTKPEDEDSRINLMLTLKAIKDLPKQQINDDKEAEINKKSADACSTTGQLIDTANDYAHKALKKAQKDPDMPSESVETLSNLFNQINAQYYRLFEAGRHKQASRKKAFEQFMQQLPKMIDAAYSVLRNTQHCLQDYHIKRLQDVKANMAQYENGPTQTYLTFANEYEVCLRRGVSPDYDDQIKGNQLTYRDDYTYSVLGSAASLSGRQSSLGISPSSSAASLSSSELLSYREDDQAEKTLKHDSEPELDEVELNFSSHRPKKTASGQKT